MLIVGAGPTGLNLALSLAKRGVPFREISQDGGPGEHSRAMAVHARTLEFYRQMGFAEEVVNAGVKVENVHWIGTNWNDRGQEDFTFSLKNIGEGISPYPFVLAYPQDDHEHFLLGKLADLGCTVEWNRSLTSFREVNETVRATITTEDGANEEVEAAYICGCDGAHSRVRQSLSIGFPGGTYEQLFYVADVEISGGFAQDLKVHLGRQILTLMLPVRARGMQRLIGLVPPELSDRTDLTFEDIRAQVEPLIRVGVKEVNWFATYRVHHRVADFFRMRRAFLLGDAGHIHSPAGGQGMNTGIGDAVNLGWKLADVCRGCADASLLDTYEPERIKFARSLVSTTDRAFRPMVAGGLGGGFFRRAVAPLLLSTATHFGPSRRALFSTVSQIRIKYAASELSEGKAGEIRGGDRLPWTGHDGEDNFAPLSSLAWQVHVYGEAGDLLQEACRRVKIPLHVFRWSETAERAGFYQGGAYLVRPDGYVAVAWRNQDPTELDRFVARWKLRL